jgi:hypothetical protein
MMIRWLKHAEENLLEREISREVVEMTIFSPELIVPDKIHLNRQVYMRRYFDELLQNDMLCRVVIEEENGVKLVVTVYKTSQIKRYFKI